MAEIRQSACLQDLNNVYLWISSSFSMSKFRLRSLPVTPQIFLNTDISTRKQGYRKDDRAMRPK